MNSRQQIRDMIHRHKRFLLTSHINMEGDSLGSQLALRGLLSKLGKRVEVVCDGGTPKAYRFLPGASSVREKPSFPYDVAFILDCPLLSRIGKIQRFIDPAKPLCVIDHHISNEYFGTVNWVEPKAAAVGEMVYDLFRYLKVKMDKNDAINLYVSIVTDTGSFRYSNTTRETHRITAELIAKGVEPATVASQIYESNSLASRRLLTAVLQTLRVTPEGTVAWLRVKRSTLRRWKATAEETEGFVDYARSIARVKVAFSLREAGPNQTKVSLRAKGSADVNRIAKAFGGGGHRAASGCVIPLSLPKAEKALLAEIRRSLHRRG